MVEKIESEFCSLVVALKDLDAAKKRAGHSPNTAQLLYAACEDYLNKSKKSLRTTIQLVDRLVEESSSNQSSRQPLHPKQVNGSLAAINNFQKPQDPHMLVETVVKMRKRIISQKTIDHWKMYCVSKRIKKAMDARLENAQKLAAEISSKDTHFRDELVRARSDNGLHIERISKLEYQLNDIMRQLEDQIQENEILRNSNKKLMTSSRAALKGTITEEENMGQSGKIKAIQEDLRLLTTQLNQSNKTATELTTELSTLKRQQKDKERELQKQIRQLATDKIRLESRLASSTVTAPASSSALEEAQKEIKAMADNVKSEQAKIEVLQSDLAQANSRIEVLESDLRCRANRISQIESQLKSSQEDIEVITIEKSTLEQKNTDLLAEIKRVKATATPSTVAETPLGGTTPTFSRVEIAKLKSELARANDKSTSLEGEIQSLKNQRSDMSDELARVRSELEKTESEIEKMVTANRKPVTIAATSQTTIGMRMLDEEVARLRIELLESEKAKTELAENQAKLKIDLENKIDEFTDSLDSRKKLQGDLEMETQNACKLRSALADKNIEISELEKKLQSLHRRLDMLSTKTPELDASNDDHQPTIPDLLKTIQQMDIDLHRLADENEHLRSLAAQVESNETERQIRAYVIDLENDIRDREEREKQLIAQLNMLDADLNNAESEIENLNRLVDEKSHAQISQFQNAINSLEEERETMFSEQDRLRDEVSRGREELSELRSAITELESQLSQRQELLETVEDEREKISTNFKNIQAQAQEMKAQLTDADVTLKSRSAVIKDLESKLSEFSSFKINLASTKSELERVRIEKKSLEAHLKASGAGDRALGEVNKTLQSQIEDLSRQLKTTGSKLESSQIEVRDLNSLIKLGEDRNRTRRHRLALVPEISTIELRNPAVDVQLKSQLKESEARVIQLMDERMRLQEQLRTATMTTHKDDDMMYTIEQLVQEKSVLTGKILKIENLLGVRPGGGDIESVISGLLSHSKTPSMILHALSDKVAVDDSTGTVVSYISKSKDSDMSGCLITKTPIPMFEEGVYFEVKVNKVNHENPDGLTVGVTLSPPWDFSAENKQAIPNTLDDIPHSWAVGYNGQCWSSSRKEWRETSWQSKDLQPGQRVGILVTCPPVSQLYIFVDDVLVCRGPSRLPSCLDNEYFGLIDLLGNCDSVSLLWAAKPPPSAANLVPPLDPRQLNFRLPTRQSVSPTSALDISAELLPDNMHQKISVPKLLLKPTAQLSRPVKPPSVSSDDEGIVSRA